MATSKTIDRREYRQLPKLRASLKWYKREVLRQLGRRMEEASSPRLRDHYQTRRSTLRRAAPATFRAWYLQETVLDIRRSGLWFLRRHLGERLRRVSAEAR